MMDFTLKTPYSMDVVRVTTSWNRPWKRALYRASVIAAETDQWVLVCHPRDCLSFEALDHALLYRAGQPIGELRRYELTLTQGRETFLRTDLLGLDSVTCWPEGQIRKRSVSARSGVIRRTLLFGRLCAIEEVL